MTNFVEKRIADLKKLKERVTTVTMTASSQSPDSATIAQLSNELKSINNDQVGIYNGLKTHNDGLLQNINIALAGEPFTQQEGLTGYTVDEPSEELSEELSEEEKQLKINNIRSSQINNYYGDKYAAYTRVFRQFVYIFFATIILIVLKNKGFIRTDAFHSLLIVVYIMGGILALKLVIDILSRSSHNFNEIDWHFKPPDGDLNADTE